MNPSVSELSRRLENALDSNYNVTDLSTVLDIVSILENSKITIEELRTTQLTKNINELRRRTSNESLARRSKNLIKRWRSLLPVTMLPAAPAPAPTPNGKVSSRHNGSAATPLALTSAEAVEKSEEPGRNRKKRRKHLLEKQEDSQQSLLLPEVSNHHFPDTTAAAELISNSSSSHNTELTFRGRFSRVSSTPVSPALLESSSSSATVSHPIAVDLVTPSHSQDAAPPPVAAAAAEKATKRRGRKKGSRGLNALLGGDNTYDTSPYLEFRNKVASGPKKVKTTKELLADLQNRKLGVVSSATSSPILQIRPPSPATTTLHSDGTQSHDTFIDHHNQSRQQSEELEASRQSGATAEDSKPPALVKAEPATDIEEQLRELGRKLVQIIEAQQEEREEEEEEAEPECSCTFVEIEETDDEEQQKAQMAVTTTDENHPSSLSFGGKKPLVRSIFDLDEMDDVGENEMDSPLEFKKDPEAAATSAAAPDAGPVFPKYRCLEDPACPARRVRDAVTQEEVQLLHTESLDHINGSWSLPHGDSARAATQDGLYERVVPQYNHLVMDRLPRCPHRRWSADSRDSDDRDEPRDEEEIVMEDGSKRVFREWNETVQMRSYNDEILTILPYVVID